MARTIADAHFLLRAQLDLDKRDPFSSDDILRIPERLGDIDLATVRVGISTDLGCAPVDNAIRQVFYDRVKSFRSVFNDVQFQDPELGPGVHDVFETLRGIYFVGAHAERLERHRDLLGPNVIDNTERGLQLSARAIAAAFVEQGKIARRFMEYFAEFDVLICPAASVSPFPHGELYVTEINGEPMATYMRWLAITYALTTAVPCAATIPCGLDHAGMPFGIQVVGPNGADSLVLDIAHTLEQVLAASPETRRPVPDLTRLTS
jgi:amidase